MWAWARAGMKQLTEYEWVRQTSLTLSLAKLPLLSMFTKAQNVTEQCDLPFYQVA
jgi:hypothetical protein